MSSENKDDRLSRLPEEIVSHILSLMPIKFAVKTCILSKRWRYNWMFVTNLDFQDNHRWIFFDFGDNLHELGDNHRNQKITPIFVDQVLKFYKPSHVKLFRLHISTFWHQESCIPRWIDKAVKLKVCELDIHISMSNCLPLSMFTCKTLTKLRLRGFTLDGNYSHIPFYLPCLKTLDIVATDIFFVNVFKLICGCPMLESLSLEISMFGSLENVWPFNIPMLKQLELKGYWHWAQIFHFLQTSPELKHLYVDSISYSSFESMWVSPRIQTKLTTMELLNYNEENWNIEFLEYILRIARVIKMLTITWKYPGNIEHELRFCAKLFSLPRASSCCKINYHGNLYHSTSN